MAQYDRRYTTVLPTPATTSLRVSVEATAISVRCKAPICGTSGQGKLLFRISADHKTLYVVCRDGHQQAIDVATLDIVG